MGMTKKEIDKRYEDRHREERKATHAVWGTSMNREDFDKLNKFLKDNGFKKVELIYAGWQALQQQLNSKTE